MNKRFLFIFSFLIAISGCQTDLIKNSNIAHTKQDSETVLRMPYNKILEPAGTQIFFGDSSLENHALDVALSPDGKILAVEGRYCIVFVNTIDNKIIYRLSLKKNDKNNSKNSYSGISWFSNKGKQYVLWGTRNKVMQAQWSENKAEIVQSYFFKPKKGIAGSIPNEMVIRTENHKPVMYVVLNGNDEIAKIELNSGKLIWQKKVGLAPYGIALVKNKIYVSNWAGSIPTDDMASAGIPWGKAQVDIYGAVSSGTVSILNPENGETIKEIKVGLHPNKIISSPDQNHVYVANGNDDNISVISANTLKVTETISVRLNHEKNPYFGDTPNALALSSDGRRLYVANGMDNALAVIELREISHNKPNSTNSKVLGFIPTAAYPGGIAIHKKNILYVANIEGIGARLTTSNKHDKAFRTFQTSPEKEHSTAGAFNVHRMLASVSVIPIPDSTQLKKYTQTVIRTNQQDRLAMLKLLPRKGIAPVPLPQRIGEPSVFKHVIYIIKENRSYDQILGDVKKANGAPELCTFGEQSTPNTHKIVNEYVLLDNYMASGKSSSEGHLWTDASIVTDYTEKNVRAWFRSYTHILYDAMAYPKTGFIWDNALDHGKSVRIYGEAAIPKWDSGKIWPDVYKDFLAGKPFIFHNITTIDRIKPILCPNYPGYDSHNVPDILRAKVFMDELKLYENMEGDHLPELMIMALPNDHSAGTSPRHPTPRAMLADNDLALGQIVSAVSHSRFWKNTVIFVTEDDSQKGWDHVSAYRTVGMVISPYSRTGEVISTYYNQTSMIRTIEQIIGLPPMNIEDATAKPMFDVFTTRADLAPYTILKNRIPLDEMNPSIQSLKGQQKHFAMESEKLIKKGIDSGEDDLLNRIIWSSVKKNEKYPAQYAGKDEDFDDD